MSCWRPKCQHLACFIRKFKMHWVQLHVCTLHIRIYIYISKLHFVFVFVFFVFFCNWIHIFKRTTHSSVITIVISLIRVPNGHLKILLQTENEHKTAWIQVDSDGRLRGGRGPSDVVCVEKRSAYPCPCSAVWQNASLQFRMWRQTCRHFGVCCRHTVSTCINTGTCGPFWFWILILNIILPHLPHFASIVCCSSRDAPSYMWADV